MHTTVARETRFFLWLVVVVIGPFGLLLYLLPGGAGDYWAWRIEQTRTAMLVGGIYFSCLFYYLLLLRQRTWEPLAMSLRSLFVVAAWLLVAAMFHWEEFFPYRPLTLVWLGAYYLPLLAIPILFRLQRGLAESSPPADEPRIAPGWRAWLYARAAVYAPVALLMFIFPHETARLWPWPIEALNIRIFSGQIAVFGAFQALAMGRGSWPRLRLFMVLTAILAIVHLVALVVDPTPYNRDAPAGYILPLVFAEWLATSLLLLATYRAEAAAHQSPKPHHQS